MQLRQKLIRIFYITLSWIFVSILQYLISLATIVDSAYDVSLYQPVQALKAALLVPVMAGILGGGVIVFLWDKWLRVKPYGWTIRNIFFSFTILFVVICVPAVMLNNSLRNDYGFFSINAWNEVLVAFSSPSLLVQYFFWLLVVVGTFIVFLVNDKYGPGIFKKFLLGKYFMPTREERVFMFLDLKSSTTIAEQLGESKYFNFLKEVFKDITPAILQHKGEIYQYVGDEIVISWAKETGVVDNNCIECFFEVKRLLDQRKSYYLSTYEVEPVFKAGLHYGFVMAGEIGVIKREIAYSGDVLNTASRIQSKCNEKGVDLLLSDQLLSLLNLAKLHSNTFGKIDLRGKSQQVELFTLSKS